MSNSGERNSLCALFLRHSLQGGRLIHHMRARMANQHLPPTNRQALIFLELFSSYLLTQNSVPCLYYSHS